MTTRLLTPRMREMLERADRGEPLWDTGGGNAQDVNTLSAINRRAGIPAFTWNPALRLHELSDAGRTLLTTDRHTA